MQLHAVFPLREPLELPIAHHHLLQSALYALLREQSALARQVHDGEQGPGRRAVKPLCFSDLDGPVLARNRRLTFSDRIGLTVRSINPGVIVAMEKALHTQGLRLGSTVLRPQQLVCSLPLIQSDKANIVMRSPLTVHTAEPDGKTRYYQPLSPEFEGLVRQNFARKYAAVTGREPQGGIRIRATNLSAKDKCLTFYHRKNQPKIIIEAWYGRYLLEGRPEYLNFLYYMGLGARNAAGFGLFDVL